ncbi:hypothetical protein V6N13_104330 [Hibiscus sabdariffa]
MRVEDLGPTVALKSASHFEEGNENALGGLGSEEGTDYLDTSDVGSYETNSDGDFLFLRTLVRSADPGGTFELMVERPTAVDIPNFKRLYVCFSALKEGFKKYCRPVISLDGCFLKGPFKGEILSIVGRDSNNQIFPIAWAMVEGLLEEVSLWLSNVEHRFCARHMYANWKKVHKGGHLQLLFWACCKATTQPQFHQYSVRIGELKKKAFDDLMEKDPQHWSKAFFSCELCPRIEKKLEEHKASSAFCHVIWNGAEGYEVEIQVAQMESNVHSSVEGSINGSPIAAQSTHQFNQHL